MQPDQGQINSVWYRFTPSASGSVHFDTCTDVLYDGYMALYTGGAVNDLTNLAFNDDGCGGFGTGSIIDFDVAAGTTYSIAIDGWEVEVGDFTLTYTIPGGPPPLRHRRRLRHHHRRHHRLRHRHRHRRHRLLRLRRHRHLRLRLRHLRPAAACRGCSGSGSATRGSGSAGPTAPSAASAAFAPGDRCAAASSGRARGPAPSGAAASRSTCWSAGRARKSQTQRAARRPPFASWESALSSTVAGRWRRFGSGCGLPLQRPAEREDQEPDPRQQQGNAHHDPEDADSLTEVGLVQGRRERRLRHPECFAPRSRPAVRSSGPSRPSTRRRSDCPADRGSVPSLRRPVRRLPRACGCRITPANSCAWEPVVTCLPDWSSRKHASDPVDRGVSRSRSALA